MIWLLACVGEPVALVPAAPIHLDARTVDEGQPAVLHGPADLALPVVEGLTFVPRSTGDDGTATWEVHGDKGSYVLEFAGSRIFLDVGVDGPDGGPMDDLAAPPEPPPATWPRRLALAVLAVVLTLVALGAWRRLRARAAPPPPPEAPDLVARRAWKALRARNDLVPEALALGLSVVYREYLERARGWPAGSRTTREILRIQTDALTVSQLDACRRLLTAMDLVKFAERETHAELFGALDVDFDVLVRPRAAEAA